VSREQQILEDYTSMHTMIPAEFWVGLKKQGLIEPNAPTPPDRTSVEQAA
jgi:hypothetical protein